MKKTVAVIVNPISGTKKKEGIKRLIYEILDSDQLDVRVMPVWLMAWTGGLV